MKKIVLLGGGHANVQVLKILHDKLARLHPDAVQFTLVSVDEVSFYSGMLPGTLDQHYSVQEIQVPLKALAYSCKAKFLTETATSLDPETRIITLTDGKTLNYDILSVDIGSRCRGTDSIPGVRTNSLMTRPLNVFFQSIEAKEEMFLSQGVVPSLIVVGAGVAGVELCFSFCSRWKKLFGETISITLIGAQSQILPGMSEAFRSIVLRNLSQKRVQVISDALVIEVQATGVVLATGNRVQGNVVVWASGAEPQSLSLHLPVCELGFMLVNDYLQSVQYPNVFGGGDCITFQSQNLGFPPKAGVYAVREGPVIAANIMAYMQGEDMEKYVPQTDFLCLINTGDDRAIGGKYGISFSGPWVWRLKDEIDRSFMKKYCALTLLGAKGLAKLEEMKDSPEALEIVYASKEDSNEDYSQQFGLEKDKQKFALEEAVNEMSPEDAVIRIIDTSDAFSSVECLDFDENLQIIKRLGSDTEFRSAAMEIYRAEFALRFPRDLE